MGAKKNGGTPTSLNGSEVLDYAPQSIKGQPQQQNNIVTGITSEHFEKNPLFNDANPNAQKNKDIYLNHLKQNGFDVQPIVNAENVKAEQKDNPEGYSGIPYAINKAYKYANNYLTNAGTGILKSAEGVNNSLAEVLSAQKGSELAHGASGVAVNAVSGVLSGAQVVSPELAGFVIGTDAIKKTAESTLSPENASKVNKAVDAPMQIVSLLAPYVTGKAAEGSTKENLYKLGDLVAMALTAHAIGGAPDAIKKVIETPKNIADLKDISAKVANGELSPEVATHISESANKVSIDDVIKVAKQEGETDIANKLSTAKEDAVSQNKVAEQNMSPELLALHKQKADLEKAKVDEVSEPIIDQEKKVVDAKIEEQEKADDAKVAQEGINKVQDNHLGEIQSSLENSIEQNKDIPSVVEPLQGTVDEIKKQRAELQPEAKQTKVKSDDYIRTSFQDYANDKGEIPYSKVVEKTEHPTSNFKGDDVNDLVKRLEDNGFKVTNKPTESARLTNEVSKTETVTPVEEKVTEKVSDVPNNVKEIQDRALKFKEENKKYFTKKNEISKSAPKKIVDAFNELRKSFNDAISLHFNNLQNLSQKRKDISKLDAKEISDNFNEKQKQLSRSFGLTDNEILDASIEDKQKFNQPLSKEEIKHANENYFIPKGFEYGENGLQEVSKKKADSTKLTGKEIEPHPEVKLDGETIVKELGLQQHEVNIYNAIKKLPKEDREKAIDILIDRMDDGAWKLENKSNVEDELDNIDRKIDEVNDNEKLSKKEKKKQVDLLNKEYDEVKSNGEKLEKQAEDIRKDIDKVKEYNLDNADDLIRKIESRIETRKGVKEGTDLFPEDANIPEFKAINKHIENGTITREQAENFAKSEPSTKAIEAIESEGENATTSEQAQSVIDDIIKLTGQSEGEGSDVVGNKGKEGETERIKPKSKLIETTSDYRTADVGNHEGQQEFETVPQDGSKIDKSKGNQTELKKQQTENILNGNVRLDADANGEGGKGETGKQAFGRIISRFIKDKETQPDGTAIVAHSSVLKAIKTYEELKDSPNFKGADWSKLTDAQYKEFAEKYIKQSTENGDIETFDSKNGKIHVVRHGQTEDNLTGKFRDDNTQLTDKGRKQAKEAGQQLSKDTPKIISSDFDRAVETSNIISDEIGKEKPKEDNENNDGENRVGISHKALNKLAKQLGLPEVKRGTVLKPEQYADMGRKMLKDGIDPTTILDSNLDLHEKIAISRAYLEELVKKADAIDDKTSIEYKDASQKIKDYDTKVTKKLGTDWAKAGIALQGERDLVTDSFFEAERTLKNNLGIDELSKEQIETLKKQTDEIKSLKAKNLELDQKLKDATDKEFGDKDFIDRSYKKSGETNRQKRIQKVDKFFDDAIAKISDKGITYGTVIPPSVIKLALKGMKEAYHAGEEIGKIVEDAVKYISDKVKGDWDKEKFRGEYTDALNEIYNKHLTPEEKLLQRKEKELQNLKDGIENKKGKTEYKLSDEEKSKLDNLNTEIKNIKLAKIKTELQKQFHNKKDNIFTPQEAKSLYNYGKQTYLENGVNWDDMVKYVSSDMGLTPDQVRNAIITPKTKPISIEKWKVQSELRKNRNATQQYIDNESKSFLLRQAKKVSGDIRDSVTFGHGHIFLGTHAGMTLFSNPHLWTQAYLKGLDLAYKMKPEDIEKFQHDFENRPLWTVFNKAGLQNDLHKMGNDMEVASQSHFLDLARNLHKKDNAIGSTAGKLLVGGIEAGHKGFMAIKWLRQEMAEQYYNNLTEEQKADPKSLESISQLVNNGTGATNVKLHGGINDIVKEGLFAGGMEVARWEKILKNPAKSMVTLSKMGVNEIAKAMGKETNELPPHEKLFATIWAKRVMTQALVYGGIVALSKLLFPDKDKKKLGTDILKINLPHSEVVDMTSGMASSLGLLGKIYKSTQEGGVGSTLMEYARPKLAPTYQTVAEVGTGRNAMGNTVPFRNITPEHWYNHYQTAGEYGESKLPLPVAEGFNSYNESHNIGIGIVNGVISAMFGFKAYNKKKDVKENAKQIEDTYLKNLKNAKGDKAKIIEANKNHAIAVKYNHN